MKESTMSIQNAAAIFGGSFNPVHQSHVQLVQEIQKLFHFDPLWIIPSQLHSQKNVDTVIAPHHRLEMIKLAFKDIPHAVISSYELEFKKPCFSIDTISHFKKKFKEKNLFFILGQDAFIDLPHWNRFPEILTACSFITVTRRGYEHLIDDTLKTFIQKNLFLQHNTSLPFSKKFSTPKNTFFYFIDLKLPHISSTLIRNHLKQGQSIKNLVPPEVEDYLKTYGLSDMLESKGYDP